MSSTSLNVKCQDATVSKRDGRWIIRPNQNAKDNLSIEVYAQIGNNNVLMGSHSYRVKNLPPPNAYIEIDGVLTDDDRIPLHSLTKPNNKLVASYGADGLVQAKFDIVGFQVKLQTGVSLSVKGDKFDKKTLDAIKKLKQGNTINIMYIKAKGPDGKEIQLRGLPIELR
jgi:hypothetical protein